MKKLFLFFATLAAFASCSKEANQSGYSAQDLEGKAFLSIGLVNGSGDTRNMENPGSAEESNVTKVTVLLFDNNNKCLDVKDFSGVTVGNSNGSGPAAAPSDAQLVPAETKKVFVVINSAGWELTADKIKNKYWSEINTAIDAQIATIATNNQFVMTSAGTLTTGALTNVAVFKAASEEAADVEKAKADAKAGAGEILIDRMAAKVQVSMTGNGIQKPADVIFSFLGWDLSVTNKSVKLYSDLVSYTGTTTPVKGIYREDKNFYKKDQPLFTDQAAMRAAFNYLSNDVTPLPAVARADKSEAYCLENTMEAVAQQLGVTTKVVVRAKYTPQNWTANTSYFMWNGTFFKLDELKAAYVTHAVGTGLKADLPIFLKKAGIYAIDNTTPMDEFVAALTDTQFTETSGITGRYCAVRYYHESVCYYDVLIFHDQGVTQKMTLGRYGVVRNNHYALQIDKVSNPGTPWIPDPSEVDPTNPTTPDTDDDASEAYLSVKMTINPWTYWSQGVELN